MEICNKIWKMVMFLFLSSCTDYVAQIEEQKNDLRNLEGQSVNHLISDDSINNIDLEASTTNSSAHSSSENFEKYSSSNEDIGIPIIKSSSSENFERYSSSSENIDMPIIKSSSSTSSSENSITLTDDRDGKVYKAVAIDSQIWMGENLNYEVEESYCDKSSNCSKYGRFYTWDAAMRACPSGWHLPTQSEWNSLLVAVGGSSTAGSALKSTSGWKSGKGEDSYGFTALPAGYTNNEGYLHEDEGYQAYFWSATEFGDTHAYKMTFNTYGCELANYIKSAELNVRCIKN